MYFYRIADITLAVQTDNQFITDMLSPFLTEDTDNPDIEVVIKDQMDIMLPEGVIVADESNMKWIKKRSTDEGYFVFLVNPSNSPIVAADGDMYWTRCKVYYKARNGNIQPDIQAFQFLGLAFRNRIIYRNSIVLHASCIEYQGKGIAFTAPSGTGKSTHTKLWEESKKGTRVINDDAPVIRIFDGKPFVYGAPWSGSTDKFLNMMAPLSAIVLLEQANENSIRPLSTPEAIAMVMPRMLLPYHDNEMMELATSTFEQIITKVPVYNLKCRPDTEAVEMVCQCII